MDLKNNELQNINNTLNNNFTDNDNNNILNNEETESNNSTYKNFSYKEKLKIRESINLLSRDEKIEILKLIIKNDEKFSENNNGTLFDLCKLTPKTLEELHNFIIFTNQNKKELNETEIKINNMKKDLVGN